MRTRGELSVPHRFFLHTILSVLVFLAAVPVGAQLLYGGLVGSVVDAQGAVIPGATVKIVNTDTNLTRETVTDAQGAFTFANVGAGPYDVKVTLTGFREAVRSRVPVTVGQISRVEMTLQVGALNEVITVQSEAQLLQTDKADVRTELNSAEITNLPLNRFRNYQALVVLAPGSMPATLPNAETDTPERSLDVAVNGQSGAANTTLTDGTRNVNVGLPHHNVYIPPAETIETVNITTGSMDAEEGMAAGIAITVITKSGTNTLKGSAFEFFNNDKLNATPYYFGTGAAPAKLPIERQTFGGTLGGPIRHNQLFFFGSYRGLHQPADRVRVVQRAGCGTAQWRLQQRAEYQRDAAAHLRSVQRRPGHRDGTRAVCEQRHPQRSIRCDCETTAGTVSVAERPGHRRGRLHRELPDHARQQHRPPQLRLQAQLEQDGRASDLGQIQPHERARGRLVHLPAG